MVECRQGLLRLTLSSVARSSAMGRIVDFQLKSIHLISTMMPFILHRLIILINWYAFFSHISGISEHQPNINVPSWFDQISEKFQFLRKLCSVSGNKQDPGEQEMSLLFICPQLPPPLQLEDFSWNSFECFRFKLAFWQKIKARKCLFCLFVSGGSSWWLLEISARYLFYCSVSVSFVPLVSVL